MLTPEERRLIRALARALDEHAETIKNTDTRRDTRREQAEEARIRAIILEQIEAQRNRSEAESKKNKWNSLEKWSFTVQVLLFIVTAGAFGAAAWYACIASGQLTELKRTNDLSERAISLQTRPWVGTEGAVNIDGVQASPATGSISGEITTRLKNYGPSPAIHVGLSVLMAPSTDFEDSNGQHFRNSSDIACRIADTTNGAGFNGDERRGLGSMLLPGVTIPSASTESIGDHTPFSPFARVQLIGCISYRTTLNVVHHTRFCLVSEPVATLRPGGKIFSCPYGNTAD